MAGGGRVVIKGGRASKGEAIVIDGALAVTGAGGGATGPPQEPWRDGMSTRSMWFTDFMGATPGVQQPLVAISAGAGAFPFGNPGLSKQDHPGIVSMTTGTTTTGRVFFISNPLASYNLGTNLTRVGTWMRTGTPLSDAANRYTLRNGLFNINLPNVIVTAVGFEYQDDQNGGRWQAITHDGVETSIDTGVLVVADTWYKMEAEINAAGTEATFFIDDVLVATSITNIPSALLDLFYTAHILKITGLIPRVCHLDAAYGYAEVTR